MLPDAFELKTLLDTDEPVVCYASVWNGKKYFHIRRIYQDKEKNWKPGKGLSIPYDQKETLLGALCALEDEE